MLERSRADFIPEMIPLTAAEIRLACPLIRADAIRPGDVLLTKSSGVEGRSIAAVSTMRGAGFEAKRSAALSIGGYSHAAIWLPVIDDELLGEPPLFLVESDDYGVGPSLPETLWIALDGKASKSTLFYKLPAGTASAMILRHPGMSSVQEDAISSAVQKLEETDYWKAYSRLSRLSNTLDVSPLLQKTIGLGLGLVDRSDPKLITGSFCSELVAKFFPLIGLDLFEAERAPETLSPNHLASAPCVLFQVEHAVLTAEKVKESDCGSAMKPLFSALNRPTMLPFLVKGSSSVINAEAVSSRILKGLDDDISASADRAARNLDHLMELVSLASQRTVALGDDRGHQRLSAIESRLRTACAIIAVIRQDYQRGVEAELPLRELSALWYVFCSVDSAATAEFNRYMLVSFLRDLRHRLQSLKTRERLHFSRKRRAFLKDWRSSRREKVIEADVLRLMRPSDEVLAELADTVIAAVKA